MSKADSKPVQKLEENELWRRATVISKAAYHKLEEYPEEEKWLTSSRLRGHAALLTDEIATSLGAVDPRDIEHRLAHARGELLGIKSIYKTSHDNGIATIDPEQMVLIESLLADIDKRMSTIPAELKEWFAHLDPPEKKV